LWGCDPTQVMTSSFLRFLDHTQRHTTVGRTPLDEWSACRRESKELVVFSVDLMDLLHYHNSFMWGLSVTLCWLAYYIDQWFSKSVPQVLPSLPRNFECCIIAGKRKF